MKLSKNLSRRPTSARYESIDLKSNQTCPFRPPVWIILFVIGLKPFDQLRVDSKWVLAVGEGVPHLGCVEVQFRIGCGYLRCCGTWRWNTVIGIRSDSTDFTLDSPYDLRHTYDEQYSPHRFLVDYPSSPGWDSSFGRCAQWYFCKWGSNVFFCCQKSQILI